MPIVGDPYTAATEVRPADDSTALTLTVTSGDNTVTTPPVSITEDDTDDNGVRYQVWTTDTDGIYDQPGEWVFRFAAANTGTDVAETVVQVGPSATGSTRRSYATTADWANHTGQAPPAGARQKLIEASDAVDEMLFGAIYCVDDDQLPTEPAHIAALKKATIIQAVETIAEEQAAASSGGTFSIGKLSVTRPQAATVARPRPGIFYSAGAWKVLAAAGLTGHAPTECW